MNIELMTPSEAFAAFNAFAAVGLFLFYLAVERMDSSLTFSLTQHKAAKSAGVTFILYITLAIEIGAIVSNYLYILPIALGGALGSYLTVQHEKKVRPLDKKDS